MNIWMQKVNIILKYAQNTVRTQGSFLWYHNVIIKVMSARIVYKNDVEFFHGIINNHSQASNKSDGHINFPESHN